MTGIIHSYYAVVMAPPIGALVGMGMVDLWRARDTHRRLAEARSGRGHRLDGCARLGVPQSDAGLPAGNCRRSCLSLG